MDENESLPAAETPAAAAVAEDAIPADVAFDADRAYAIAVCRKQKWPGEPAAFSAEWVAAQPPERLAELVAAGRAGDLPRVHALLA